MELEQIVSRWRDPYPLRFFLKWLASNEGLICFLLFPAFLFGVAAWYISCIRFYFLGNICFDLFNKKNIECLFF